MSLPIPSYCFQTAAQWAQCLITGFTSQANGSLLPDERLGSYAVHIPQVPGETGVPLTVDAYGQLFRLNSKSEPMARSPRLIVDREWAWWFEEGKSIVYRSDLDTLERDLELDVERPVLDIATDNREGIWILCGDPCPGLKHFNCMGSLQSRFAVPFEASGARQLVSIGNGATLALLTHKGARLIFVDGASGRQISAEDLGPLAEGWKIKQFVSDARDRIAIWGVQPALPTPTGLLFLFDSQGNIVDGPLSQLFDQPDGARPPQRLEDIRIAVNRQTIWLFTDTGLWRAAPTDGAGARPSLSSLTTPALFSPVNGTHSGWLRAEASVTLSQGAALNAWVFTTDDQTLVNRANNVLQDPAVPAAQKQDAMWDMFRSEAATQSFSIPGPTDAGVPIAIPMLEPRNRWAWVRLSLMTPPGDQSAPLTRLRVLYPNQTIAASLPAVFRGKQYDPSGTLRSLVGVLETTTQQFDEQILGAAAHLNPATAPTQWLDYLARWFDLPWDGALPTASKRGILNHIPDLLQSRGARNGLEALLKGLLGPAASVQVVDVTVDHPPLRLGGSGVRGGCLPAVLPGVPLQAPVLGVKAVTGRACLGKADDPLATIAPTVHVRIVAAREVQTALQDVLPRVLNQYAPAGVNVVVRWCNAAIMPADAITADGIVLDGPQTATLGRDTTIGQSLIGGRDRGLLGDIGFGMGRLQ